MHRSSIGPLATVRFSFDVIVGLTSNRHIFLPINTPCDKYCNLTKNDNFLTRETYYLGKIMVMMIIILIIRVNESQSSIFEQENKCLAMFTIDFILVCSFCFFSYFVSVRKRGQEKILILIMLVQ